MFSDWAKATSVELEKTVVGDVMAARMLVPQSRDPLLPTRCFAHYGTPPDYLADGFESCEGNT